MTRLVILAPNWLGDAVMALPAVADVRRAAPESHVAVAARPSIAPLFDLVSDVNEVIILEHRASIGRVASWSEIGRELAGRAFDVALLLPNSVHAALVASRAGIRERWGYRSSWRSRLLTRAVQAPSGLHQVAFYQHLVAALGFPNGSSEPRLTVAPEVVTAASRVLADAGWKDRRPLAAVAPGAAYGGAKRWPPESFAELIDAFAADGVQTVLIGTSADAGTVDEVVSRLHDPTGIVNLAGRTDLPTLAGVLTRCRALVTNDSGAMHLAAAVGVSVTAVFGPTNDRATRPLGEAHVVITNDVWCRPCMLRECPLDHRCMRGINVARVHEAARRTL
jgi:lipopolysaccharide heptosyltransferase II